MLNSIFLSSSPLSLSFLLPFARRSCCCFLFLLHVSESVLVTARRYGKIERKTMVSGVLFFFVLFSFSDVFFLLLLLFFFFSSSIWKRGARETRPAGNAEGKDDDDDAEAKARRKKRRKRRVRRHPVSESRQPTRLDERERAARKERQRDPFKCKMIERRTNNNLQVGMLNRSTPMVPSWKRRRRRRHRQSHETQR